MLDMVSRRVSAFRHKAYVRTFSRVAPYLLVNEFPKSGGTWLATMLSELLDLPFRRNEPIRFERAVTHGHFLAPAGIHRPIIIWRDPRDVIVSFYYHSYFVNEHQNAAYVEMMRARHPFADYDDIKANLPEFIRVLSKDPVSPRFSWPQFAAIWADRPGTIATSYEALRADTETELARVVAEATGETPDPQKLEQVVEQNSFARAKQNAEAERKAATQMSFIREGSLGKWREKFSDEALAALKTHGYWPGMVKLGYESERSDS